MQHAYISWYIPDVYETLEPHKTPIHVWQKLQIKETKIG